MTKICTILRKLNDPIIAKTNKTRHFVDKSVSDSILILNKRKTIVRLINTHYGKKMRATEYKDGIKRIKAKIEVPMSELDARNYVLSAPRQRN